MKPPASNPPQFSNLCGTVYRQGNLLFTPDGNSLISPVGNRVTVFDLVKYAYMGGHRQKWPGCRAKNAIELFFKVDGSFLKWVYLPAYCRFTAGFESSNTFTTLHQYLIAGCGCHDNRNHGSVL
jgi:periodic tryptophan protein 2